MASDKMDEESEERLLKILSNSIRATIVRNLHKDKLSFTNLMRITGCKTGQLSFHLKKLDYLVEQDELKRYKLSDKGMEDVEAILPYLSKAENNISEEETEVSFAFKLFVESLIHLTGSCIFAIKHFVIQSCKHLVEICSRGTRYFKILISKSSSHIDAIKIFCRRAADNVKLFSKKSGKRLSQMINETVKSFKSIIIVIVKSTKCSMNPMFSYSLMIIGLMLFVPAAFISASPQFDSLTNSVAYVDKTHLSIEQMAQANQLYEKELLPNQQNYQDSGYNSTLYESMNYINKFGYPLTPETIDTWQNEYVKRRIQYIKDNVFAALSISSVMMLIGALLAFEKKILLKRFFLSTTTASILLLLVSVILLISINAGILADFNRMNEAIGPVTFIIKNFIGMLLLITFLSSGSLAYIKTKQLSPESDA